MNKVIETIKNGILSSPYVPIEPNLFDSIEFRLNKREMGHIHNEDLDNILSILKIGNERFSMIKDETRKIGGPFF
jgi:hypothetical protein